MSNKSTNSFTPLIRELANRLKSPIGSFTFWVYALIGIVGFSGLAIWIEVCQYIFGLGKTASMDGIRLAINTYFPAVGCSAALQLFIAEREKAYLRSFGYAVSVLLIVLCILSFLLQSNNPGWSLFVGISCSAASILVWWIANGADPSFQDVDLETPLGGPTGTTLPGDTTGFSV